MPPLNAELRALLVRAGCDEVAAPGFSWTQLVMVHNVARIPAAAPLPGDSVWMRGFNLLVLDRAGRPRHYAKCRPPGAASLSHETRVLEALAADASLLGIVPAARGTSSATMQVQVTPYLDGRSYEATARRESSHTWGRHVTEILEASERIGQVAIQRALVPDGAAPLSFADEAAGAVDYLELMGLAGSDAGWLRDALDAGGVVRGEPQHGDLWPANIIETRTPWTIVDFEVFGNVRLPLYDAWNMARSAPGLHGGGSWLAALTGPGRWGAAAREVMRRAAARRGLRPDAMVASLVAFLARMASDSHRRGNPREFWSGYLDDAAFIARQRRVGADVAALLTAA